MKLGEIAGKRAIWRPRWEMGTQLGARLVVKYMDSDVDRDDSDYGDFQLTVVLDSDIKEIMIHSDSTP